MALATPGPKRQEFVSRSWPARAHWASVLGRMEPKSYPGQPSIFCDHRGMLSGFDLRIWSGWSLSLRLHHFSVFWVIEGSHCTSRNELKSSLGVNVPRDWTPTYIHKYMCCCSMILILCFSKTIWSFAHIHHFWKPHLPGTYLSLWSGSCHSQLHPSLRPDFSHAFSIKDFLGSSPQRFLLPLCPDGSVGITVTTLVTTLGICRYLVCLLLWLDCKLSKDGPFSATSVAPSCI